MRTRVLSLAVGVLLGVGLLASHQSQAQPVALVRDAEVENIIRAYAKPVFAAAGYSSDDITVFLVNDRRLNAFVAGGLNLFLNTGLLVRTETPEQLIGVIAHETGHIAGGHLARSQIVADTAFKQGLITYVLGAAAAIASGRGDVAMAVMSGGAQVTQAGFLKYSRTQESAADQAALRYLEESNISAEGLLEFLQILQGQELLVVARRDPYLSTHPLNQERMDTVRAYLASAPAGDRSLPPRFQEMQDRMHAKLRGFLEPASRVLRRYPPEDESLPARYARAIVYYRQPDLPRALGLIDGLIAERPDDPYFHELKGQMLFENGRIYEAVEPYREAVRLLPNSGLLRTSLAQAQLETNDPLLIPEAIEQLEEARRLDDRNLLTLRLLAVGYGRNNQLGMASLYLAELALGTGKKKEAAVQAERALRLLPPGARARQRAHDIKREAEIE